MSHVLVADGDCRRCGGAGVVVDVLEHALLTYRTICRCVKALPLREPESPPQPPSVMFVIGTTPLGGTWALECTTENPGYWTVRMDKPMALHWLIFPEPMRDVRVALDAGPWQPITDEPEPPPDRVERVWPFSQVILQVGQALKVAATLGAVLLTCGCGAEFYTEEEWRGGGGSAGSPSAPSARSADLPPPAPPLDGAAGAASSPPPPTLHRWVVVGPDGLELDSWEGPGGALCARPASTAWWGWPDAGPGLELEEGAPLTLAWELEGDGVTVSAHVGPSPGTSGPIVFRAGPLPPGPQSFAASASSSLDSAGVALRVDGAQGGTVCLLSASFNP